MGQWTKLKMYFTMSGPRVVRGCDVQLWRSPFESCIVELEAISPSTSSSRRS